MLRGVAVPRADGGRQRLSRGAGRRLIADAACRDGAAGCCRCSTDAAAATAADRRRDARRDCRAARARATGLRRHRSVRRAFRRARAASTCRLGLDPQRRIEVSDYGFAPQPPVPRDRRPRAAPIGFVGTHGLAQGRARPDRGRTAPARRFEVVIAGDPNVGPEYHARLKRDCRRSAGAVRRAVRSRAMCREIYGGLDVLVVPSLWPENSPLVIHEAFMHGVAVVGAAAWAAFPSLVDDGVERLHLRGVLAGRAGRRAAAIPRRSGLAESLASRAPAVKTISEDAQ